MGLNLQYDPGQTPLDPNESEGLLVPTIATQGELNEAEQLNIEDAVQWTLQRKFTVDDVLTETFVQQLHRKMYGGVWQWAGEFRKTNKNIGTDKFQISIELRKLIDDCKFWIGKKVYPPDEIAVRFKHKIVSIHCFPNGNGRHSRLIADIIISHIFKLPVFAWGSDDLYKSGTARASYLQALKKADKHQYKELLKFARG